MSKTAAFFGLLRFFGGVGLLGGAAMLSIGPTGAMAVVGAALLADHFLGGAMIHGKRD